MHRQNISFSMHAHALNRGPCVILMFSRREWFKASQLFSLVFRKIFAYYSTLTLFNTYYSQNYVSIMCQGLRTLVRYVTLKYMYCSVYWCLSHMNITMGLCLPTKTNDRKCTHMMNSDFWQTAEATPPVMYHGLSTV